MSRIADESFANKRLRSQSTIFVHARGVHPRMESHGKLPSKRISTAKHVANQRAKARQIVACLQTKGIKLVAIDFDNTLLSIHTSGYYQGTVDNLIEHIRSTFYYLIQAILDSPAFGESLHICIVTFSSQEQLIRKLLQLAFVTP